MEPSTIARSYASALFELGERTGELESFARAFAAVNALLASDRRIRAFLRSPRIDVEAKKQALAASLRHAVPPLFFNFLMVVLDKGRQRLLPDIAREFELMLDERLGRVNVQVTLAHEPDARELDQIARQLTRLTGRTVIPHVHVDPSILGGIVVRYGDRLLDGSLRRRLMALRSRLLETRGATGEIPTYRG